MIFVLDGAQAGRGVEVHEGVEAVHVVAVVVERLLGSGSGGVGGGGRTTRCGGHVVVAVVVVECAGEVNLEIG